MDGVLPTLEYECWNLCADADLKSKVSRDCVIFLRESRCATGLLPAFATIAGVSGGHSFMLKSLISFASVFSAFETSVDTVGSSKFFGAGIASQLCRNQLR